MKVTKNYTPQVKFLKSKDMKVGAAIPYYFKRNSLQKLL
jgi:hypothetical protein